jgi:hypothetical protein
MAGTTRERAGITTARAADGVLRPSMAFRKGPVCHRSIDSEGTITLVPAGIILRSGPSIGPRMKKGPGRFAPSEIRAVALEAGVNPTGWPPDAFSVDLDGVAADILLSGPRGVDKMFFNVSVGIDGPVQIKAGASDPLKIRPHTFYTSTRPQVDFPTDPGDIDFVLEEARVLYGARRAIKLQPGTVLLCTPTRGLRALMQIPTSHLWPYSRLVSVEAKGTVSASSLPSEAYDTSIRRYVVTCPIWTIDKYTPDVLFWGVHIDYELPRPELAGIYYGTVTGRDVDCSYFPRPTLISGVQAFLERAVKADVLVTNSDHELKLYILEDYLTKKGVKWSAPAGLMTSVEAILSVAVPGLNCDFPEVVESWARRTHGRTSRPDTRGAFVQTWSTDYTPMPISFDGSTRPGHRGQGEEPGDLQTFFRKKIHAFAYISIPLLASKMQVAIETGVDLRCVLDPTELGCAMKAIHGVEVGPSPATVFSEGIRKYLPGIMSIGNLLTDGNQVFYVYDARAYMEKRAAVHGLPAAAVDGAVRVHSMEEALLDAGETFLLMYEYGVILDTRLEGLEPIFVFSSLIVSRRGIFGQSSEIDGGFYGYGDIGREASQTRALERKFLHALSGDSAPMRPLIDSLAAYNILASPSNPEMYQLLCTRRQYEALTEGKIPIPLTVWMSPDGVFTSTYERRLHSTYNGKVFPSIR